MAHGVYKEARTPSSKGKKLSHLTIKQGDEGGHVVEHHYADDGMVFHKPTSHVFGEGEGGDLLAHIAKHAHIKSGSDETDEQGE